MKDQDSDFKNGSEDPWCCCWDLPSKQIILCDTEVSAQIMWKDNDGCEVSL